MAHKDDVRAFAMEHVKNACVRGVGHPDMHNAAFRTGAGHLVPIEVRVVDAHKGEFLALDLDARSGVGEIDPSMGRQSPH